MKYQNLLQLFSLTLVVLLLVGCGNASTPPSEPVSSANTPTPVPQVDTQTPEEPTATPDLPTPTPTPDLPTPTPTPDFSSYAPEIARLFEAHRAITSVDTFEALTLDTGFFAFSTTGAFEMTAASGSLLTMTTYYVQDESPNVLAEYELTTEDFKINAETRFVDGNLYFQGQREVTTDDTEDIKPMPEGWVTVENIEDWPALDRLPLDTYFEENVLFVLDEDWDLWLTEPTETSTDRGTADDGTPADIVNIIWSGKDLEARWPEQTADDYQITDDSKIEIIAAIDDEGRLIQYAWSSDEELVKEDQTGNSFTQTSASVTNVIFTNINTPIEPVEAP